MTPRNQRSGLNGPELFLGIVVELLTVALAAWFWKAGADPSKATGFGRYIIAAVFAAPVSGGISLAGGILNSRWVAAAFAWSTVFALAIFSALIWFAFYGIPILVLWVIYAVVLQANRPKDESRESRHARA